MTETVRSVIVAGVVGYRRHYPCTPPSKHGSGGPIIVLVMVFSKKKASGD